MRRMSPTIILVAGLWVIFMAWIAWGYVAVRGVEQPPYTVLEQADGYEVREYPAYLIAQVSVQGSWSTALADGFSILAKYIFGDNIGQTSMSMTAPVGIESEPDGERIAMSAPVLSQKKDGVHLISFIMPRGYTSSTLPRPNNPQIRIIEQPASVVAVRVFSGWVHEKRAHAEEQMLRELLARDKRVTVSVSRVAQYNPPWTPPFLRRNEVMIAVRRQR